MPASTWAIVLGEIGPEIAACANGAAPETEAGAVLAVGAETVGFWIACAICTGTAALTVSEACGALGAPRSAAITPVLRIQLKNRCNITGRRGLDGRIIRVRGAIGTTQRPTLCTLQPHAAQPLGRRAIPQCA